MIPDNALLLVPLIAFLEACVGIGLFVSGVFLLSFCTFLYVEQVATIPQMMMLAFAGACLSDHGGYYLGRWIGPGLHHTRFAEKHRARIEKTEEIFRRFGEPAIVIGRLIPAIRSVVPVMSGISGITPARYTGWDLLACAIWVSGLGLLVAGLDQVLPGVLDR